MLSIAPHPELRAGCFTASLPAPLAELPSPEWLTDLLALDAPAPLTASAEVRAAGRDLLRHGGYKPTGRGKPAAEYLVRAAGEGALGSINLAVDACNVVSLHSGWSISVIDLDRAEPPLAIRVAEPDASYVFNASGQEIRLRGLLCLCDARGPCATAVKDAQRTKTHAGTHRTLSVVWGNERLAEEADAAVRWYRELLERCGAPTADA